MSEQNFIQESGLVFRDYKADSAQPQDLMQFAILSGEQAREFIRKEVCEALEEAMQPGAIDPREYMHIDIREMDGRRWRGMVYAIEPTEETTKRD